MTLARARHQRAAQIFSDEGGSGLLGVDAPVGTASRQSP